jgi:hypothetical protein
VPLAVTGRIITTVSPAVQGTEPPHAKVIGLLVVVPTVMLPTSTGVVAEHRTDKNANANKTAANWGVFMIRNFLMASTQEQRRPKLQ